MTYSRVPVDYLLQKCYRYSSLFLFFFWVKFFLRFCESSEAPEAKALRLSSLSETTLISTGTKLVLSNPTEFLWEGSNRSELFPSLVTGRRFNSGATFDSSKGRSHSTQASTFDFGVLWFLLLLLRLQRSFLFVKNFGIKLNWPYLGVISCSKGLHPVLWSFFALWFSLRNYQSSRPVWKHIFCI